MSTRTFQLVVVSPERTVVEEPATQVVLPGVEGYFGVLAGHVPLVAELQPGVLRYRRPDGSEERVAISGGFAEVTAERVVVLADTAERAEEIDVERARQALQRARELLHQPLSPQQILEARLALERARARLKAAGEEA